MKYCWRMAVIFFVVMPMISSAAWKIISPQSQITFIATQNNSPLVGEFKKISGDIEFNPAQFDKSKVKIIVDLNSVTTAYPEVAGMLKSADWFNVQMFSQAIFVADNFEKVSDKRFQAAGVLTLRDKILPIQVYFILDQYSPTFAKAHGSFKLKRLLFGVGRGDWEKTDNVKDDVQVNFNLTAVNQ